MQQIKSYLEQSVEQIMALRHGYIEMLAAAWLKETAIPATEAEIVEVHNGTETVWFIRRRNLV